MARHLSKEEVTKLMEIKEKDVTRQLLIDFFANTNKKNAKYNTNDRFILPKERFIMKENIETTVGRYLVNTFLFTKNIFNILGYINEPITGGKLEEIENKLAEKILEKKITGQEMIDYINRLMWITYTPVDFITPSINIDLTMPLDSVQKRKMELVKKYEKELKDNPGVFGNKIEKELISMAEEKLKDNPCMDIFKSGAKCKFANQYKNIAIMRGPILQSSSSDYHFSTSNYAEGIKKEDYNYFGDLIVSSVYPTALGTRTSGYETKRIFAAFQSVTLDKEGSDCKTTKTIKILIRPNYVKSFLYRYIVENNKLVLLTNENIKNYVGKYVNLRSPMACTSKQICSKCAGELYYRLGIKNIGLTAVAMSGTLLNRSLKKKHDTTIKIKKLDYKQFMK